MNYPEFDLEKALAGEPAALKMHGCIAKTVIKKSVLFAGEYLIEMHLPSGADTMIIGREDIKARAIGMWAEPVEFKHWDVLRTDIKYIAKDAGGMWFGCYYKPSLNERMGVWDMEESYSISALAELPDVDWRHSLIKRPEPEGEAE